MSGTMTLARRRSVTDSPSCHQSYGSTDSDSGWHSSYRHGDRDRDCPVSESGLDRESPSQACQWPRGPGRRHRESGRDPCRTSSRLLVMLSRIQVSRDSGWASLGDSPADLTKIIVSSNFES